MKERCESCGEKADLKNKISSVYHEHNNSSGVCRKVKLVGHFESVDGTGKPKLCIDCQNKVVRGFSSGGNWS